MSTQKTSPNGTEQKNGVKIIFWGTPEFALPSLEGLIKNNYRVIALITKPDEPMGRGQKITPPPAKKTAEKYGIRVLQPTKLDFDFKTAISNFEPDLFVVAAYGKLIPKEILDIPKYGAINIHPSLLPRYRGPSPIQHTILNGDKETGATLILMDEKMDHGPIVASRQLEIRNPKSEILNSKITYPELHNKLAMLGAELLIETLPRWLAGEIKPAPQDESKAVYCKMLKKEDGKIDWTKPAENLERQIRAFLEWPGSYTFWQRGNNRLRLEIEAAEVANPKIPPFDTPGLVWQKDQTSLLVETGRGSLCVIKVKLAGKKAADAKEFLNGYKDIIGAILR